MTENISVVIITRNREKMLGRCLESLVSQTRLPDEVVVVDNASTDNTKKVILSFKEKLPIRYVQELKIGIPYARNRGLQHTTGSLILMLDDDCSANKFWVERMAYAHKKYPKAWVIQGRTFSLPKRGLYSALVESDRLLWLLYHSKKGLSLRKMKSFFNKDFRDETAVFTCDTRNFSIKTSYLKKHKLFFDLDFYRGSDTDLGEQILQKNGLIIFCSSVTVDHWERPNLAQFLEQRWHIGRTTARVGNKWKTPSFISNIPRLKTLLALFLFCQHLNQLRKLPILMILLLLDRLYRINGWFYEKRILSFSKH